MWIFYLKATLVEVTDRLPDRINPPVSDRLEFRLESSLSGRLSRFTGYACGPAATRVPTRFLTWLFSHLIYCCV